MTEKERSLSPNRLRWEAYEGMSKFPKGAVLAGREKDGSPLYAGRACHNGEVLPAKISYKSGYAFVAWGGDEHRITNYEVMVSDDTAWTYARGNNIPSQAVKVGQTSSEEPLYMGRAYHERTITPGKVQLSHECVYIPFNGKEIGIKEYEILVLLPHYQRPQ